MRFASNRRSRLRCRGGNITILAALFLVVAFGMVAFSVDVGHIVKMDTELQRTADACALAIVGQLPDQSAATSAAQSVANKNKGALGPDLEISEIEYGDWDRDTATFSPTNTNPNAVRVTLAKTKTKGNPLTLFFAPLIGTGSADVTASAIAMYDQSTCGPLVGIDWISVPGTPITDSYRSSDGPYALQTPRNEGDICSDGPINIDGQAYVGGDANPGRGYQTTLTGNGTVVGNTTPRLRPLNMPLVDTTHVSFNNDNASLPDILKGRNYVAMLDGSRNFTLDGGRTYTIPSGTYYLNNLTLTGSSTLHVDPGVKIYLTGLLDTSGGDIINASLIPNNFQVYMTGETARIAGDSANHMVLYAPNSGVEVTGSGDYNGVVVGKTLTLTGTGGVHYDEDVSIDGVNIPKRVALVK